tara:strand:+ start:8229 stop:9476 length:1248 start_codon:yes stop_codon:yes gene_type:complete
MASSSDGVKALKALGFHADPILDAYLNHRGQVADTAENEPVIKSLLKHHLAWRYDDNEDIRLNGDLIRLLGGVTRDFRRSVADEAIGELWRSLQEQMGFYKESKLKGNAQDRELYSDRVQELCFELIEALRHSIVQFSFYITSGFAYVKDLNTRARENVSVINRAKKLNDILESFRVEQFERDAGADPLLRRLLLFRLPKAIEQCNKELIHAIHRLGDILHKIRQDQHLSQMVNRFASRYDSDRGFMPDVGDLTHMPQALNVSRSLLGKVYADIEDAEQVDALSALCRGLRISKEPAARWVVGEDTAVQDATEDREADPEPNPLYELALKSFEYAKALKSPLSAKKLLLEYQEMNPDEALGCSPDLWLLTLVNTFQAQPVDVRERYRIHYAESCDRLFPNVYEVDDVLLEWRQHV